MRLALCKLPAIQRSPRAVFGNIASSIMCALRTTSLVTSLSHEAKKRSISTEGFAGRGEITVLSHFAVVMAVLTGVAAIFVLPLLRVPLACEAGERSGDIGLVIVLAGEHIESSFL